ncbi:TPA: glycosyltransferase [Photobacterium damselae]
MIFAVNATALRFSGALTILKQFIKRAKNSDHKYFIFISADIDVDEFSSENIIFIKVSPQNWITRIIWDSWLFNKRISSLPVSIDKIISLQNTTVRSSYPQIVYLHQPIPFSDIEFNVSSYCEFKLYLYKRFYAFFIFLFCNEETKFFVQTEWMKRALCKKFHVNETKVFLSKPDIILPNITFNNKSNSTGKKVYLYPATYLPYKNHLVILKALSKLSDEKINNINVQFTLNDVEYSKFHKVAERYGVSKYIVNLGVLEYEELIDKYIDSDGVLFPSYLETYGLPLAEAATLNKLILCADLPYAHDVLSGYNGVKYIPYDDSRLWANSMKKDIISQKYEWISDDRPSWDNFFNNL